MQVATQVSALNESGELAGRRCFYFAPILAQFGSYPGNTQGAVDFLFGPAGDSRAFAKEPVFVEQESTRLSDAPQVHVVGLRSCKINQRRAKTLRGHDSEVHLHPALEYNARLGLT